MQIPSQNLIESEVTSIAPGLVNAQVDLQILPGNRIRVVLTTKAWESLNLKDGDAVIAIVPSTHVLLAAP